MHLDQCQDNILTERMKNSSTNTAPKGKIPEMMELNKERKGEQKEITMKHHMIAIHTHGGFTKEHS